MSSKPENSPYYSGHANAFAGIQGSVSSPAPLEGSGGSRCVSLADGALLLDPAGRWAVRLYRLPADSARIILQILRDLADADANTESVLIRQVAAYDEACAHDRSLGAIIQEGVAKLDALAQRLTKLRYVDIEERPLRRTLLTQLADIPLMERLGVRLPAYSGAAI